MKKEYRWVTEGELKRVHALFQAGLKTGQVCNITGRSYMVVQNMKDSANLEEYKKNLRVKFKTIYDKHEETRADKGTSGGNAMFSFSKIFGKTEAEEKDLVREAKVANVVALMDSVVMLNEIALDINEKAKRILLDLKKM